MKKVPGAWLNIFSYLKYLTMFLSLYLVEVIIREILITTLALAFHCHYILVESQVHTYKI